MAFTDTQKAKILYYLGYSLTEEGWTNSYIDEKLDEAGAQSETQTIVEDLLSRLDGLDYSSGYLDDGLGNLEVAAVKSIVLRDDQMEQLRTEGERLSNRLALVLNIPMKDSGGFAGRSITSTYETTMY